MKLTLLEILDCLSIYHKISDKELLEIADWCAQNVNSPKSVFKLEKMMSQYAKIERELD